MIRPEKLEIINPEYDFITEDDYPFVHTSPGLKAYHIIGEEICGKILPVFEGNTNGYSLLHFKEDLIVRTHFLKAGSKIKIDRYPYEKSLIVMNGVLIIGFGVDGTDEIRKYTMGSEIGFRIPPNLCCYLETTNDVLFLEITHNDT